MAGKLCLSPESRKSLRPDAQSSGFPAVHRHPAQKRKGDGDADRVPARGPAGLYFAISMKLRDARHEIHVFQRNRPDDTFGWGVVFSDQTVHNLLAHDPVSGAVIRDAFAPWDGIEVHVGGETVQQHVKTVIAPYK